jgi:hypothetical protein
MKPNKENKVTLTEIVSFESDRMISNLNVVGTPRVIPLNTTISIEATFTKHDIAVNRITFTLGEFCSDYTEDAVDGSMNRVDDVEQTSTTMTFEQPIPMKQMQYIADALEGAIKNLQKKHKEVSKII